MDLEKFYSTVETPSAKKLVDVSDDRQDVVYQKGSRLSEETAGDCQSQGRWRRPEDIASKQEKAAAAAAARASTSATTATASTQVERGKSRDSSSPRPVGRQYRPRSIA